MARLTYVYFIALSTLLISCATQKQVQPKKDIYASITNNQIEYRDDEKSSSMLMKNNTAFVDEQLKQVRGLFFQGKHEQAAQLAERIVRQAPYSADAYYWLARIRLQLGQYEQAQQIAQKGISVAASESNITQALYRLQRQAIIGGEG